MLAKLFRNPEKARGSRFPLPSADTRFTGPPHGFRESCRAPIAQTMTPIKQQRIGLVVIVAFMAISTADAAHAQQCSDDCQPDFDGDRQVEIHELVRAVNLALNDCPAIPEPTVTPTPSLSGPCPDVSGVWEATSRATPGQTQCTEYAGTLTIEQMEESLSGSYDGFSCAAPPSRGVLTGHNRGGHLEFTTPYTEGPGAGSYSATWLGTVSADCTTLSGTWTDSNDKSGTWFATRQSGAP